jgi:hypothetical protein
MSSLLWDGVREGCGTCEFWALWPSGENVGSCKRYPPAMIAISNTDPWGKLMSSVEQHVPTTQQADWCGEYRRKNTQCSS